ncbi:hypothetical protein AAG906_027891 [Vitis piasezkii]
MGLILEVVESGQSWEELIGVGAARRVDQCGVRASGENLVTVGWMLVLGEWEEGWSGRGGSVWVSSIKIVVRCKDGVDWCGAKMVDQSVGKSGIRSVGIVSKNFGVGKDGTWCESGRWWNPAVQNVRSIGVSRRLVGMEGSSRCERKMVRFEAVSGRGWACLSLQKVVVVPKMVEIGVCEDAENQEVLGRGGIGAVSKSYPDRVWEERTRLVVLKSGGDQGGAGKGGNPCDAQGVSVNREKLNRLRCENGDREILGRMEIRCGVRSVGVVLRKSIGLLSGRWWDPVLGGLRSVGVEGVVLGGLGRDGRMGVLEGMV